MSDPCLDSRKEQKEGREAGDHKAKCKQRTVYVHLGILCTDVNKRKKELPLQRASVQDAREEGVRESRSSGRSNL